MPVPFTFSIINYWTNGMQSGASSPEGKVRPFTAGANFSPRESYA